MNLFTQLYNNRLHRGIPQIEKPINSSERQLQHVSLYRQVRVKQAIFYYDLHKSKMNAIEITCDKKRATKRVNEV